MSNRVTALEPEQRAALAAHADAWASRVLSTEPVNWARWEAAVRACYHDAGLRWPGRVVRVASPLALARALFVARVNEVPGDEDRALVGPLRTLQGRVDRFIARVFAPGVTGLVQREVFLPVDSAVGGTGVAQAVEELLYSRLLIDDPVGTRDSALAAARQLVTGPGGGDRSMSVRRKVPAEWRAWTLHLGGRWDAGWSAYASFFRDLHGEPGGRAWRRRVDELTIAQSADWWWPHLDYVLVSDPPVVVRTEHLAGQPSRLHCADGPALAWRDGWRLHFWHGTRVPAWVVEHPTVEAVHAEPNVEVRRCGIEALGWDTYIDRAGLVLVDEAADPGNPGCRLQLFDLPERVWGTPTRVLLAVNGSVERDGTRRRYGLPVPGDVHTAVHAAAWTYGLTGDQYARLDRRT